MAFNPFSSFQKNQKFWMATLVLLSMVTFVFCSGGGDMSERILRWFRGRGKTIVEVGGYDYSYADLSQLRQQRNMVNDFMRKMSDIAVQNLTERIKEESAKQPAGDAKKEEGRKVTLARLTAMQDTLLERLRRPRYFEPGVKFQDLVDFITWKAQADRLDIRLTDQDVIDMTQQELFGAVTQQQAVEAILSTHRNYPQANEASLRQALREEYRVQMAQLALYEMQPFSYIARTGEGGDLRLTDPNVPDEQRLPMSLAQLWKIYEQKRGEFDVTLVPVPVAAFKGDVGEPTEEELQKLFAKYKGERYDPLAATPGFEVPQRAKIEFVMADPTSPAYLGQARAKQLLETLSPLHLVPTQSALVTAARVAALNAAEQALLQRQYESLSQVQYRTAPYTEADFVTPMAAWLAKRQPTAVATLVGAGAVNVAGNGAAPPYDSLAAFLAQGALRNKEILQAGIAAEVERRAPLYATVAAAGLTRSPYLVTGTLLALDPSLSRENNPTLPLAVVREDIEEMLARRTAETWASGVMQKLKRELEENTKPEAIRRTLNKYVKQYNLTRGQTEQFVNRFTVGEAKELAPLREAYLKYMDQINWFEGRDATPEKLLRENDFHRLFFDGERFSAGSNYQVKAWPPAITPNPMQMRQQMGMPFQKMPDIQQNVLADVHRLMQQADPTKPGASYQLFSKAEKPVLFWKTETKPAEYPEKLADVRDRVVEAWKLQKAREAKALPAVKQIAEALAQADVDQAVVDREAAKIGQTPIVIRNLAEWHPDAVGFKRDYFNYPLPKGVFEYPREDLVQDLLQLPKLKKPIDVKAKEVDDLNKTLFNQAAKAKGGPNQVVQVLTNRPQTAYYVAVVSRPPTPERGDFVRTIVNAPLSRHPFIDSFVARAQDVRAREFREELLRNMRESLGYWVVDSDNEERKALENEGV